MADAFLMRRGGEDVTAEVNEQTPLIQEILEALVGKVQGANATPETILEGYKAYVGQELVTGLYKPIEGVDYGSVTITATNLTQIAVECNLPSVSRAVLLPVSLSGQTSYNTELVYLASEAFKSGKQAVNVLNYYTAQVGAMSSYGGSITNGGSGNTSTITFISINYAAAQRYLQPGTYAWVALGGGN